MHMAQCFLQELMPNRKQNGKEEIPHQTLFTVRELQISYSNRSLPQHLTNVCEDVMYDSTSAIGLRFSETETGVVKFIPVLDAYLWFMMRIRIYP